MIFFFNYKDLILLLTTTYRHYKCLYFPFFTTKQAAEAISNFQLTSHLQSVLQKTLPTHPAEPLTYAKPLKVMPHYFAIEYNFHFNMRLLFSSQLDT